MERDSSIVEEGADNPYVTQYGEPYDDYPIFTAHDSDLNLLGIGLHSGTSTSGSLSELDISLPSTDLDLETRIFGRQKKKTADVTQKRNSLGPSGNFVQEPRKAGSASRRSLHMGDSDPEGHVFHPEIVPFEPSKNPFTNSPKDPRKLLESKEEQSSVKSSDPNSARYLKILIPQRDSLTAESPTAETSINLFESLNISAAERLLLESPTDSPSHFKQAQLRLDTADSELEGSFVGQEKDHLLLSSTPRKRDFTVYPNQSLYTSDSRSSQDIKTEIFDFEAELKKLVVDIYSDREPDFAPLPGSSSSKECVQSTDFKMSEARSELEKAFGGGE